MSATAETLQFSYVGANPAPQLTPLDALPGVVNYFIGRDSNAWQTNIPTYGRVSYQNLYPGIDLTYYGNAQGQLEYNWTIAPGADPGAIALAVQGAQGLSIDAQGNLVVQTALGPVLEQAPVAYQLINGQRQDVAVQYTLNSPNQVGLSVGAYDTSQPLIIDPVLGFSTYLGGSSDEACQGIALDSAGNIYVTGDTASTTFPTTTGAYSTTYGGGAYDVFVTKFTASGSSPLYSTYVGGNGYDQGNSIAVDSSSHAYVTGFTASTNFPTTTGTYSGTYGGGSSDAFAFKLNQAGSSLIYSTYLGGNDADSGLGIALDTQGHALVTGNTASTQFPTTAGAYSTTYGGGAEDAFVAKLNDAGTALLYSTYLGGSGADYGQSIVVNSAGNAYIGGQTSSTDFPLVGAAQGSYGGGSSDAFVAKLSPGGSALVSSTYIGGSGDDEGFGIAIDSSGAAYLAGLTTSSNFPTHNALQSTYGGAGPYGFGDAFVTKLNSSGNALAYSTYLGGSGDDNGYSIAVDSFGQAYVSGETDSSDFPTANPLQGSYAGPTTCTASPPPFCGDAFVSALNAAGSGLLYSTYLGGAAEDEGNHVVVDGSGTAYLTGYTYSGNFLTANAEQNTFGGGSDAYVTRILPAGSGTVPWHPHRTLRLSDTLSVSVDLSDGHADVSAGALDIPGRGPDLTLNSVWDSTLAQAGSTTTAGQGWVSSLTPSMTGTLTGTVRYSSADGAIWPFQYTGSITASAPYTLYATPPGLPWQLSTDTSGYTLTNVLNGQTLAFDSQGRYLAQADAYSNAATLTYSGSVPITWTAAGGFRVPGGRAISLGYNNNSLLSDVQSPLWRKSGGSQGQHVTYAYNSSNQLTTLTRGAGTTDAVTETFGYSGTQLVMITTGAGHQWTVGYDANGRVVSVTSPASGTVGQAGYSPAATTAFTYNAGQTVAVAGFGSSTPLTTTYTLSAAGEATAVADGLNDTSTATYDQDHDVLTSTDPDSNTTTNYFAYVGPNSSTGLITKTVQPAIQPYSPLNTSRVNPTTQFFYNATNDLTETIKPEGGKVLYGYDGHHSVITTTELVTGTSTWRGTIDQYDGDGELTGTIDGRAISVNASGVAALIPSLALSYTSSYTYSEATVKPAPSACDGM